MSLDLDLHRRAFARCTVSEPHRDADEDLPCSGCLLAAAKQLAIASHLSAAASTSSSVAPPPHVEGVDGAAGPCAGTAARSGPAASIQTDNRPPAVNEGPAEGATAFARNESMP